MLMDKNNTPRLNGYNFSEEEYLQYNAANKLLTLRIDTNLNCNLNCLYCAWRSNPNRNEKIDFTLLKNTIKEAKDLGIKSVIIIGGGEPTLYECFSRLIEFIDSLKLIPVIITNGVNLNPDIISYLKEKNCSISVKLDSFDESIQDKLTGRKGSFKKQKESLELLKQAFIKPSIKEYKLALSFVITKLNIHEIIKLWKYCRENHIVPNANVYNTRGRGESNKDLLMPGPLEVKELFAQIKKVDEDDYKIFTKGYSSNNACLQHLYSVYIDVFGYIRPCPAIENKEFNISRNKLKEALKSEYYKKIRKEFKHLDGGNNVAMINL